MKKYREKTDKEGAHIIWWWKEGKVIFGVGSVIKVELEI